MSVLSCLYLHSYPTLEKAGELLAQKSSGLGIYKRLVNGQIHLTSFKPNRYNPNLQDCARSIKRINGSNGFHQTTVTDFKSGTETCIDVTPDFYTKTIKDNDGVVSTIRVENRKSGSPILTFKEEKPNGEVIHATLNKHLDDTVDIQVGANNFACDQTSLSSVPIIKGKARYTASAEGVTKDSNEPVCNQNMPVGLGEALADLWTKYVGKIEGSCKQAS